MFSLRVLVQVVVLSSTLSVLAADVKCPVPKPKNIPEQLTKTFSTDPAVTFETRAAELDDVLAAKKSDAVLEALRWLIHQPTTEPKLRDAAVNTLLPFYEIPWLADDLNGMMNDPAQALEWRVRCVHWLARYHERRNDDESWKLLETAAVSSERPVRNLALEEVARPVQIQRWFKSNPELYQRILGLVEKGLTDADATTICAALRGVLAGELKEKVGAVEKLAADAKQPKEVREAALNALTLIARPETLAVLDSIQAPDLAEVLTQARAAALVTQLESTDNNTLTNAYKALGELGAKALPALRRAVTMERSEQPDEKAQKARELARTLWGNLYLTESQLPAVDRTGMRVFLENKEKNRPGVKGMWIDLGKRTIIVQGESLLEQGPLEYAVMLKGSPKAHESVVQLNCTPGNVCLAILACAYVYTGELMQGDGKAQLQVPTGGAALVSVEFEREYLTPAGPEKKTVRVPLNTLIYNNDTQRPMKKSPWVLNGSTRRQGGGLQFDIDRCLAALRIDPDALMNTVLDSAESADFKRDGGAPFYEINRALIPKKGSAVNLVIEPFVGDGLKPEDLHDMNRQKKSGSAKPSNNPPPGKGQEAGPIAE